MRTSGKVEVTPAPGRWPRRAFVAVAAVVLLRTWNAFTAPTLAAEDGTWLFLMFLEEPAFADVLQPYAGYVALVPAGLGGLVGFLPVQWRPALLAACAGLIAVLFFSRFASRRFAHLLPDDRARAWVCVLLALLPYGNARLVSALMYANWHLLGIFLLMSVARPPARGRARWGEALLLAACAASNPLSVVAVPVLLLRARGAASPGTRGYFGALAVAAVAWQVIFVGGAGSGTNALAAAAPAGVRMLGQRVLAEAALGGAVWPGLGVAVWAVVVAVALGLAAGVARLRGRARRHALALVFVVLGVTASAVLCRPHMGMPDVWWGNRYSYLQRCFVYVLAAVVVTGLPALRRFEVRRSVWLVAAGHVLALLMTSSEHYESSRAEGRRVAAFCREVDAWLQVPPAARPALRLERVGEWDLVLPPAAPR